MSTPPPAEEYAALEAQLLRLRTTHENVFEDLVLARMDDLWLQMTDEERRIAKWRIV